MFCSEEYIAFYIILHHVLTCPIIGRDNVAMSTSCVQGVSPSAMPSWMESLHRKLTDSRTAANVKLFISRLIVNVEEVSERGKDRCCLSVAPFSQCI